MMIKHVTEQSPGPAEHHGAEAAAVARTGPMRFALMTGSSIAGRDAAPWVTDFLCAAFYRRPVDRRMVDDLRLAFCILTTYWYRNGAYRLHVTDVPAFHRAYGGDRFNTEHSSRGTLSRAQLLDGASRLIGDWFPEAYDADPRPGPTTPARSDASRRCACDALEHGIARYGDREPRALPAGGQPLVGFDLTTHQGHFMRNGHNRLLLYTHEGKTWVRAAGTWDPMPWHIDRAYRVAGHDAQHAFWGQGGVARLSMLHQLAEQTAA